MVYRRWHGANRGFNGVTFEVPLPDPYLVFGFPGPTNRPGDVLKRILVGWALYARPVQDVEFPLPIPLYGLAVWYAPNPQAPEDPTSGSTYEALHGDALLSEYIAWVPTPQDSASHFSLRWNASSGGMVSAQGERTIVDPNTATLNVGLQSVEEGLPPLGIREDLIIDGYIWIKYLVEHK